MNDSFDRIRAAIARDLQIALKTRDRVGIAALRSALDAMDNATALPVGPGVPTTPEAPRRKLWESDLAAVLQREIDARIAAAGEYLRLGRAALADDFHREADVIRRCLRHLPARPGTQTP